MVNSLPIRGEYAMKFKYSLDVHDLGSTIYSNWKSSKFSAITINYLSFYNII